MGGGITCKDASPVIANNIIVGNETDNWGGGIWCSNASPIICDNIIADNTAHYGGGVSVEGQSLPLLSNNTIHGNLADEGGGLYCSFGKTSLGNSILWNNAASVRGDQAALAAPATLTVDFTDLEGAQSGVSVEPSSTLVWGAGMIDADPLFVDPAHNDFHLSASSACRDKGHNAFVQPGIFHDFENDPRIADGTADMGADEFYPHCYSVDRIRHPGDTLELVVIGEPGTADVALYKGAGIRVDPLPTAHGDLFLEQPLVKVVLGSIPSDGVLTHSFKVPASWSHGEIPFQALVGALGSPDTVLTNMFAARIVGMAYVPDDYATIQAAITAAVDGEKVVVRPGIYSENLVFVGKAITVESEAGPGVTIIDGGTPANPDFPSVVTFNQHEGPESILSGFTLTNGTARKGGGVFCRNASPTIEKNLFVSNSASADGGAIYCIDGGPLIMDNVIVNNEASTRGGGIYCESSELDVVNTVIAANSADNGGGVHCYNFVELKLVNCTLTGNSASSKGGAVYGKICCNLVVANSIFWANSAPEGPTMRIGSTQFESSVVISYCDVEGGAASFYMTTGCPLTWGAGMIDADPLFVEASRGDCHIAHGSPCRDSGNNSALPWYLDLDCEGDPRIAEGCVDMGADEFYPHLYSVGAALPGGTVDIRLIGEPGTAPVKLALGSALLDPPEPTAFGDLYLALPLLAVVDLGTIPSSGVISWPAPVPASWPPGSVHPFQALQQASLTNLMVLRVE